jgi:hypothetical protein
MSHRCKVCHAFTTFVSCPYCGAMPVERKTIDRATGIELVRGLPDITYRAIQRALDISATKPTDRVVAKLVKS